MPCLRRLAALSALLLAPWAVSDASAEDPPREEESPLRLYAAHALMQGRSEYIQEKVGIIGPDSVNDEEHPLFGAEGEEPILPVGSVDELVELLRYQVDPSSWDSVAGANIAPLGTRSLLVRQTPSALEAVGRVLKTLEDRWLRSIQVDVVCVRLPDDSGKGLGAERLAALAAAEDVGPGLSLVAFPGQLVSGFNGRQVAYLQDYDVEVAQKAQISDPIVGVLNAGLSVAVRAIPSAAGDRVRLDIDARLAQLRGIQSISAGDVRGVGPTVPGDLRQVESPQIELTFARSAVDVPQGAWALLDGASVTSGPHKGWAFLARARVGQRQSAAATRGISLPVLDSAGMSRLEDRALSIELLSQPIVDRLSPTLDLWPSNFTPPEPPELPEPSAAVYADALVELLRQSIAPEAWGQRGGSLDVRKGTLFIRAPGSAILATERMLATLEKALLWAVEIEAQVLDVPASLALGGSPLLGDDVLAALAQALASGAAQQLEHVRVTSLAGGRNNVLAGSERLYMRDYEVEIAEDARIGNPVPALLRTGIVLDVTPALTSTRDSVVIATRLTRSSLTTMRTNASVVGEIQLPDVSMLRLRSDIEVPLGRTGLLGSASEGGRRTVVLLTPRLAR